MKAHLGPCNIPWDQNVVTDDPEINPSVKSKPLLSDPQGTTFQLKKFSPLPPPPPESKTV